MTDTKSRTPGAPGLAIAQALPSDFRYPTKRPNNPPAGLAAQGRIEERPKERYAYDPHLPPVLRFDQTGDSDRLPDLLAEVTRRTLTDDEARLLAAALRNREPWLEWTGKREKTWFEVESVALHIYEHFITFLRLVKRNQVS
jgi:adenine-specific DNA-methyltransferase